MFLGTYVGPPLIWQWQRIPGDIGTSGQESVVVVGSSHFFIGPHDIYVYDGTVPRSIGAPVREWFFGDLNNTWRSNIIGVSDLDRDLVYWYYPSNSSTSGAIDSCLVYNIRTNQWGVADRAIEAAISYSGGGVTYDGLGTLYSTYDGLPSLSYDSPFWLASQTTPAIIGTDHKLYFMTGTPGASYLVTGDVGDETTWSMLRRVTPRYRLEPTQATCTNFYRPDLGQSKTQDATIPQSNFGTQPRFDMRRNARWHSARFDWMGQVQINGSTFDIVPTSKE